MPVAAVDHGGMDIHERLRVVHMGLLEFAVDKIADNCRADMYMHKASPKASTAAWYTMRASFCALQERFAPYSTRATGLRSGYLGLQGLGPHNSECCVAISHTPLQPVLYPMRY